MTQFSDLPSCLIIDILLRLPLKSLVACRCVCKDWILWFRDPSFIKPHLAASPIHILSRGESFQFPKVSEYEFTGRVGVKIVNIRTTDGTDGGDLEVKIVNLIAKVNLPHNYECVNSCNGLLCFVLCESKIPMSFARTFLVCNPILAEWISISTPVREYPDILSSTASSTASSTTVALVFSPKNNQYKVLHGFRTSKTDDYRFEIYTLGGTRQWRSIDETLGCRPWKLLYYQDFNALLPGSLHWCNSTQDFISCFDVDNEKFRRFSLPIKKSSINSSVQLGVVNGCLCAFFSRKHNQTGHAELWVMKEYGVEKLWARILTLPVFNTLFGSRDLLPFLLFSLNEEEILIHGYKNGLVSYNWKRNTLRHCPPFEANYVGGWTAYKPSFISLQDVAEGEQVI